MLMALDAWIEAQPWDHRSRPEAIRRLVEIGLAVPVKSKRTSVTTRRAASVAAEKAAHEEMDRVLKDHPAEVWTERKTRLTSMPGGFKRR